MTKDKMIYQSDIERLLNDNKISMDAKSRAGVAPAYVMTNEDMRKETELSMGNNKRVLTVTASGDQALFYLLAGADHIDTYDMTYCAKIIQEIKFAAIRQQVPYNDYLSMLTKLHNDSTNIMNIPYMSDIIHDISPTTAHFIKSMKVPGNFSYGSEPCDNNKQYLLTPDEYARLQTMKPQTPSFIWSNILDLHKHIRGKYDIINMSNIFDYIPNHFIGVLRNMEPYLTPDGKIITEYNYEETYNEIYNAANEFAHKLKFGVAKKSNKLVCIQRTR